VKGPGSAGDSATDTAAGTAPLTWIRDDQGRVRVLHGMNVMSSAKSDPERMPALDAQGALRMSQDWGFNFARFLIFWDALEPVEGEIDPVYLDRVEERLDWFDAAGIQVVLDMHQDVYAQRFCCDGAPDWAIRDDGQTFTLQDPWFLNYLQPAVQRSFDNFWAGDEGADGDLQEHYAQAWAAVAARLDQHPAVLGYDIMNEPSPGSAQDLVELLGTENPKGSDPAFDTQRLQPFYQRVIQAIREQDPDGWIFYEPRYGAPSNGLPSYMGRLEDPREGPPHLASFPHYYSLRFEATQRWDPDQDSSLVDWESHRSADAAAQGAPLLVGEVGFDTSWEGADQALRAVMEMADRATSGWAWWSLDPGGWGIVDSAGKERPMADVLVRPYPQLVAGTPLSYGYDPETRVFRLELAERAEVTGPTVLSLPAARHYPTGWTLSVSDADGSWSSTWDADQELLSITLPQTGQEHWIEVRPQ